MRAEVGSLQVSPRRDQVAWARSTDYATVQPASAIHSHPIIFPTISHVHNNMQSQPIPIQTHNHRKHITQPEGSSFPYLENGQQLGSWV